MQGKNDLERILNEIDGRGYGAYKRIRGSYDFEDYELYIDYVQGDPYAAPSNFRVRIKQERAGFPDFLFSTGDRKRGLEDFLTRRMDRQMEKIAKGHRGSGKSGMVQMVDFGQAVLDRTSLYVDKDRIEARFKVGLPAKGRTVMSRIQANQMIFEEIEQVVVNSLIYDHLPQAKVKEHVETIEDSAWIRSQLSDRGLVAFVADGARLPRESGVGDRPMKENVVPFQSPESLKVEFDPPNRGKIAGMGVPEGITLIVGGGYHGKSTLLNAIAQGVYDHIPKDGREYVVTNPSGMIIRAEDGRFVESVDISPFIQNLPSGIDTSEFSTEDASGSTSQAANIMESLEVGAKLLLIDEDISATNFMIRDERMQELVAKEKEPITPLIDKIDLLYKDKGVSVILVMGGSGDYFDVADTVVMMDAYRPLDVTKDAKKISQSFTRPRKREGGQRFGKLHHRRPQPSSINPHKRSGKVKIRARGKETIQFGYEDIDLSKVHQISELPQARSIGDIIYYLAKNYFQDGQTTIRQALDQVEKELKAGNLHKMIPYHPGDYGVPRKYEIAAALNRLRTLEVT